MVTSLQWSSCLEQPLFSVPKLAIIKRLYCICVLISVLPFSGSLRLDEPLNPPSPARNNHIHGSMQLAGHSKLHHTYDYTNCGKKCKITFKKLKICSLCFYRVSYRNTSGSLGEWEMLWEHELQASVSTGSFSSSPKLSWVRTVF